MFTRSRKDDHMVNDTKQLDFSNWYNWGMEANYAKHLFSGELPSMMSDRIRLQGLQILTNNPDFTSGKQNNTLSNDNCIYLIQKCI